MAKIIDLKDNLQRSELVALVFDKSDLITYSGGRGKFIKVYLKDDSAQIQLTLFADYALKFQYLEIGKKYCFKNVYATKANEKYPCINVNLMELKATGGFNIEEVEKIIDLDTVLTIESKFCWIELSKN